MARFIIVRKAGFKGRAAACLFVNKLYVAEALELINLMFLSLKLSTEF